MSIKKSLNNLQAKSDKVRERAASELGESRSPEAVEALIAAIKNDPSHVVRSAAARGLKNFAGPQVNAALIESLKDGHSKVATEAGNSLAALGDPGAIAPLIELLRRGGFAMSRRASATLAKFGAQAVRPLMEVCRDNSAAQNSAVIQTLANLGGVALRPLIEALGSDDRRMRQCAAKALGLIGDRAAVAPLLERLGDADPGVAAAAARALGELREPQSLDALLRLLDSRWTGVRRAAAAALGKFNPEAAGPLFDRLADEREYVRLSAADALSSLGNEAVEERIIEGSRREPNWRVRQAMVRCLSRIETDDAFECLLDALDDEDHTVRESALITIGNVRRPLHPRLSARRLWRLTELLRDPNEPMLFMAARALVRVEEEDAAEAIVNALSSESPEIRLATTTALRNYFSVPAASPSARGWFKVVPTARGVEVPASTRMVVDELAARAGDDEPGVRQTAVEALTSAVKALRLDQSQELRGVDTRTQKGGTVQVGRDVNVNVSGTVVGVQIGGIVSGAVIVTGLPRDEPPPRYADFTFYEEERRPESRVQRAEPLRADHWYELEVAVRVEPTGIPSADGKHRPIRQPRQDGDAVLLVTAESKHFEIKERVRTLTLPPSGDSPPDKCAVFKVRPLSRSDGEKDLAKIDIRLFYKLNLLEAVIIRAEVADEEDGEGSQLGLPEPISYARQKFFEQGYVDFNDLAARELHIDVTRPGNNFVLTFTLLDRAGNRLALTGSADLTPTDLEDLLLTARGLFEGQALGKTFTQGVQGKPGEWRKNLRDLATHGNFCWKKLFKQDAQGSLFQVGRFLEENPPEEGGIVQVTIRKEARQFIFPWALLYPKAVPEQTHLLPEPRDFWGWRYVIEQRVGDPTRYTDLPVPVDGQLSLAFMLWQEFRNAKQQEDLMADLVSRSAGKLKVSKPPITRKEDFTALINNLDAQILYFYTHGHTRLRQGDIGYGKLLQSFVRRYEELEADNPARQSLQPVYDLIKGGGEEKFQQEESWIELSKGRIHYSELLDIEKLPTQPLVFLNMCESAQITPSLSEGFVDFFLNRKARAVIGTECMMTVEFAHPFAKAILEGLLAGEPLGRVMLDARREFVKLKNPLGLAYTLFGSATLRFDPPRFKKNTAGADAGTQTSNQQNPERGEEGNP